VIQTHCRSVNLQRWWTAARKHTRTSHTSVIS